jgi:hypothetical protein
LKDEKRISDVLQVVKKEDNHETSVQASQIAQPVHPMARQARLPVRQSGRAVLA